MNDTVSPSPVSPPQGQTRDLGGANSSTSPAVDVPKAPQGQTAGSGNIEQEGGWLGAVAQGLVGTVMAPVRHDSPAQAVDVAAWDPAADGGLTSFEQKISEARMWNTVDPGHVVVSNLKGIDTPYNDHFRVVGQELTAKQLASARAIQYCDETGAKHGWVTSEGAADILWSREGKLLKAVNTHATYDTQPGFAASLLNPVDLLSGAIAGKLVGRAAIAAADVVVDAIIPKATARSAAKGFGVVKTAAGWIKKAALRLVSRGAAEEAAPKIKIIVRKYTQEGIKELRDQIVQLAPKRLDPDPNRAFMKWGIQIWGQGGTNALAMKAMGRTAEVLDEIGLTVENATILRDFCRAVEVSGLAGGAPAGRVELLEHIIETLSGGRRR